MSGTPRKQTPEELAEKSAATAEQNAEPEPVKEGTTHLTQAQIDKALEKSRKRLAAAGQLVENSSGVVDASPTFAGYDSAGDSAPIQTAQAASTQE